jgi:type II restriction enzyme
MARKQDLRKQRTGTVINGKSKKMEGILGEALKMTEAHIKSKFPTIELSHENNIYLKDIVAHLKTTYPDVEFGNYFETSSMKPDGGILYLNSTEDATLRYPILITEVKNQGTNDVRLQEGKKKQAEGNAIERLGKNVIGFRTALMHESIFPFVCFGDGCDFMPDSSILDRVVTISMFGALNKIRIHNEGSNGCFNRGSFFFRQPVWTADDMFNIMKQITESSIYYYISRYGESCFLNTQ